MVTTDFKLEYQSTVGFHTDQGSRGFQHPSAFAMRSDGRFFVASRGAAPTTGVQMVSKDFEFFGVIGQSGTEIGQMVEPSALALDSGDNLYVADERLNRITVFDKQGGIVGSWGEFGDGPGQFNRPTGLLISNDIMFLVDTMNHRIQKYSKDGEFIGQWGMNGKEEGEFNYPWGISKGINDELIIADWGNDRILSFDLDGEYISSFQAGSDAIMPLYRPAHAAVDKEGNLYVADWGNQILQVFDSNGKFLMSHRGSADLNPWALEYFEAQQDEQRARVSYVPIYEPDTDDVREVSARMEPYFWDPCSVIVDQENRVYVLETCRHRFQIFERV